MKKFQKWMGSLCLLVMLLAVIHPLEVKADTGNVRFGSQEYSQQENEVFPIGVYVAGNGAIESYRVEVTYDSNRMEYQGGGDREEDGAIILEGSSGQSEIRYLLSFRSISGGEANIQIAKAAVKIAGETSADVIEGIQAPVHLAGADTVGNVENVNTPENEDEQSVENASQIKKKENQEQEKDEDSLTKTKNLKRYRMISIIMLMVGLVALLYEIIFLLRRRHIIKEREKLRRERKNRRDKALLSGDIPENIVKKKPGQGPVISVQNVTMKFRISTSTASGIKEYFIQWVKKQITYRELVALDHISFNVFKGEVVGIIGTNGSGKSTLLRIVSGALNPTSGRVVVDRDRVQLLTLGTGFDMELTARENVYLNGAIIGYSKEFIDAHFDEIVEFAELQDFMDEKVKNFSSGMVSRLGFAIATAGDAAEILILDEVLSVGDEFFQKKSLARVKEMIHGGSTVLMVSHSMKTIQDNCSKVVWIEKGKLQMVGEAQDVCRKYREMGNQ